VQTRSIGSIPVPLAGIGCNNFGRRIDEARVKEVVDTAFEVGATLFDTADLYGDGRSEEFLGKALRSRRDEAVVVSKFGMRTPPDGLSGGDPAWVPRACDDSLTRLATDRIDVYLLHTPDDATPIADTLTAMSRLVDAGKVREVGCSNFSAKQLEEAEEAAREKGVHRFVTVQNEYSLLAREPQDEVLPACRRLGISFIPYFPLASGLLTGKYRRGEPPPPGSRMAGRQGWDEFLTDERFDLVERLSLFAQQRGYTLLELAMCWLAMQPEIATVIAGATSAEQVRANAAAIEAWRLSDDELAEIDDLLGDEGPPR
jgi:aryl-alcohol dehydrogenase-like predicted oxidoreductase